MPEVFHECSASIAREGTLVQPQPNLSRYCASLHLSRGPFRPTTLCIQPSSSKALAMEGEEDRPPTMRLLARISAVFRPKPGFTIRRKRKEPQQTFAYLFSLPGEIRERIYEYCCDNDRIILEQHFAAAKPPPEPAIACASRRLREEALPVFYRHYRFPVTFHSGILINEGTLPPSQEWKAARWYHRLDANKLAMIRRLDLYYCFGRFSVEFDARSNDYEVEQTGWGSWRVFDVHPQEERVRVLALVRSALDHLLMVSGVGSITARDIDGLEIEVASARTCKEDRMVRFTSSFVPTLM